MSGKITIDLSEKNYSKLITYLTDMKQASLIKMIQSGRDDDYVPKDDKKMDRYEYYSGSAEEEEYEVEMDSLGRMSLM
tara:strand:+ start:378 stop:611 length:234 start_codon:yes stop_codon:yes gene_type:complete